MISSHFVRDPTAISSGVRLRINVAGGKTPADFESESGLGQSI